MIHLDQAGAVEHSVFVPVPDDLRHLVEHFGVFRYPRSRAARRWRIVPDASAHVVVSRDASRTGHVLVGARGRSVDIDTSSRRYSVVVRFRPGAIGVLSRVPARKLTDVCVSLEQAFGRAGAAAASKVDEAGDPRTIVDALVEMLRPLSCGDAAIDWRAQALDALFREGAATGVAEVARTLGLSVRTLQQVALDEIGLSPKHLFRIHRLQKALGLGLAGARSLAQVAAESGYADQPHFSRDCRSLLGESPRAFLSRGGRERGARPRCRFVQDAGALGS